MTPTAHPKRTFAVACIATAAAALLAACGGGEGEGATMTTDNAQGYAADSATMPVSAATAVDSAIGSLESALSASASSGALAQPQAARPQATGSDSASCRNGGTVAWSVTGPDTALIGNGRFDGGEVYTVTYTRCGDGFAALDGVVTLTVNARTSSNVDLTHSTSALTLTTGVGKWVVNGSTNARRSSAATSAGGTEVTSQLTSSGVTLESTIGPRQASYALKTLDWTIVRTYDANGLLAGRSHDGTLVLDASTPRRPNATLQITTEGALSIGSDGLAAAGSFKVLNERDSVTCSYGGGTLTLALDLGNDGTIDRTWTLTRTVFDDQAG